MGDLAAVIDHLSLDQVVLTPPDSSGFAKTDGSGAVFLMNLTDTAEAHRLLEALPLGQAQMMTFDLIKVGPLWPLGLLVPAGS